MLIGFPPRCRRQQAFERAIVQAHRIALAFHRQPQHRARQFVRTHRRLPIALSVSHASSKAASRTTSVCGSNEEVWNPRMSALTTMLRTGMLRSA